MKKITVIFFIVLLPLAFVACSDNEPAAPAGTGEMQCDKVVSIEDSGLYNALREAAGVGSGPLCECHLETVTELEIRGYNYDDEYKITDLSGIEYCTNLVHLRVDHHKIYDLSPLSGITTLQTLQVNDNRISDLTPLAGLTGLNKLILGTNKISGLAPLSSLTNLDYLDIAGNRVEDLTALDTLGNLRELYASNNRIDDISPLSPLSALEILFLSCNYITNIFPLGGLGGLETLALEGNEELADIGPVSGLTNLDVFTIKGCDVEDLGPVVVNCNGGGLVADDEVVTCGNPLNDTSSDTYIPYLRSQGVIVWESIISPQTGEETCAGF